jgi:hypothetical protein
VNFLLALPPLIIFRFQVKGVTTPKFLSSKNPSHISRNPSYTTTTNPSFLWYLSAPEWLLIGHIDQLTVVNSSLYTQRKYSQFG